VANGADGAVEANPSCLAAAWLVLLRLGCHLRGVANDPEPELRHSGQ